MQAEIAHNLARAARAYDKEGRFAEADKLERVLLRLAQRVDPQTGQGYLDFSEDGIPNPALDASQIQFRVTDRPADTHDAYYGYVIRRIEALMNGRSIGHLDYKYSTDASEEVELKVVEVPYEYRRLGIADQLYAKFKQILAKDMRHTDRLFGSIMHPHTLSRRLKHFGTPDEVEMEDGGAYPWDDDIQNEVQYGLGENEESTAPGDFITGNSYRVWNDISNLHKPKAKPRRFAQFSKQLDIPLDARVVPYKDMENTLNEQDQLRNDHPRLNPDMVERTGPDEGEEQGAGSLEEQMHGTSADHKGVALYTEDSSSAGMNNLNDYTWDNTHGTSPLVNPGQSLIPRH